MNANKNNSGWILRPSKSFPGKFYYFNVLNGDTAWSLEDNEKKDDGSPKVLDVHDHPEPSSPPPVDIPHLKYSSTPHLRPFSSIQKTLQSIPEEMTVVWTPVEIQVPIVITPKSQIQNQDPRVDKVKPPQFNMDKFQYNTDKVKTQPESNKCTLLDHSKNLFVHASSKPLSQRFLNFEEPLINFDKNNKLVQAKMSTSTPLKQSQTSKFKTVALNTDVSFVLKKDVCEVPSKVNVSSDLKKDVCEVPSKVNVSSDLKKDVCEVPSKVNVSFDLKKDVCEVPSKVTKKVGKEVVKNEVGNTNNVKENDLRLLLQAKKRQFPDEKLNATEKTEAKKIKLVRPEPPPKPKKKVTFEMDYDDNISIDDESENEHMNFKDNYAITLQCLKSLAKPECVGDYWYIVVDTDVLLEEFSFLDSFVKIDGWCKLIIPPSVLNAVSSLARGDCRGRTHVTQARNVLRKIPDQHILVLTSDDEGMQTPPNDAILKTCVEAMDQGIHLILITNNEELLRTAKCYPIHCYNIQDIKNGLAPKEQKTGESQSKNNFKSSIFDELNEKEIEIITRLKSNMADSLNNPISNENSRNSRQSIVTNKDLISNDCSRISYQNANENPKILNSNSRDNSKISNNTMISLDHSTNAYPNSVQRTNSRISNENSTKCTEWSTNNQKKSIFDDKTTIFETKEKEPQNFENDVFKKPQSINKKNNSKVDLREFYVKSKIMENRLKERIDEFVCFFTQTLEDSLTGVLVKLSPTMLRTMPPPWFLYEALQCVKTVYKDHLLIKSIVEELHVAMYDVNVSGTVKIKKNINPGDFMKALGCGIHLIQYLKKILPHSEEILETEECLLNMLKDIENPTNDIIEPLVQLPAVSECDYKEVKHNFVKNTSEIINYLKKHYPEWQSYEINNNSQMAVIRTCGRDLNLLKLNKKATVDTDNSLVITKNVGVAKNADVSMTNRDVTTRNVVTTRTADVTTRNGNVTTRNGNVTTRNGNVTTRNCDVTTRNCDVTTRNCDVTARNCDVTTRNCDVTARNGNVTTRKGNVTTRNCDVTTRNCDVTTRKGNVTTRNCDVTMRNAISTSAIAAKNMKIPAIDTEFLKNCKVTSKNDNVANTKINIPKINQKNAENPQKLTEKTQTTNNDNTSKPKSPKIVRNMQIIEKFEKILKRKKLEAHSPLSDDDITHYSTNDKDALNTEENLTNEVETELDKNENNVKLERKSDKDDTTNDSGIGNERPEIYSVVTKFSLKLNSSLEKLRTFIDGTFKEFHEGKLHRDTKKMFRLKVFEANFMVTKIIAGLIKMIRPRNGGKIPPSELYLSAQSGKNKEVILNYIKQAQILQKTLNFMLSVPHEEELNSSISLNASS